MTGFSLTAEDRIGSQEKDRDGGIRTGWAVFGSLLFHGTAVAAILIAAYGVEAPTPSPAIEVSVVVLGPTASGGAPAGARSVAEPPASAAERLESRSEAAAAPPHDPPAAVETAPAPDAPTPVAAGGEPIPATPPPVPVRKPDPPQKPVEAADAAPAPAEPAPAPAASAPSPQLAALPDGDSIDSVAAPGAGVATPPRYQAGGEGNPWPRYPAAARRRGVEGQVLVQVAVSAEGKVEGVELLRSSGNSLLDRAALEALARWRFEPARAAGQPVAGTVEIPVTFRLTDREGS